MQIGGARAARRWDVVAAAGLVAWVAFDLTARTLFGSVPWPESVVDYRIIYDASTHVVETHRYPTHNPYPYPPPAVALHAASAAFPFPVSAALWLGLTGLSALATYAAVARVLGLHLRPGTLTVLPLAHVVAAYYFQWDMRSVNSNLVMLAAVALGCAALARGREAAAGFWFALAVALKVLPVLLLPYLAWSRRWRALASAAAFSIVFWGAVPLLAFGAGGAAEVYAGWGKELTRATDAGTKLVHPILISLDKATLYAVGGDAAAALAIRLGVCGLWVGLGLLGAAASFGGRARDGFSVLAHASLLVVGPAAVNPYLEPYHLVALAIPAVLLLSAATDPRQSARVRLLALAGFAAGVAVMKVPSPWPLRGLFVNAQSLLLCGTAVFVGWARVRQSPPGETGGAQAPGWRKWGKLLARVRPAMARRG